MNINQVVLIFPLLGYTYTYEGVYFLIFVAYMNIDEEVIFYHYLGYNDINEGVTFLLFLV
jgi:hypothetical protein